MLIDTHTHLTDSRLDERSIIANMAADGLQKLITVGYDYQSSLAGLKIAEQNANVYCALGVHPSDVKSANKVDIAKIAALLSHSKVVAAGEIGLDYHYDDTDRQLQKQWLIDQIEAYSTANVPLIFHLRDAYEDMYKIISERRNLIRAGAVMHCFSGSQEEAKKYLQLGFYLSFSGTITYPSNKKSAEIIKNTPLERILIETDCPYLTPQAHRGKTNQPAYVKYQADKIAEILQIAPSEVQAQTATNAYNLFTKMKD